MEDNVIKLIASSYKDVSKHSIVLNLQELDYFLWIYTDPNATRDCYLFDISEIDENKLKPIMRDSFIKESNCWIKMTSDLINKEIGYHLYKLSFVNRYTDVSFSLYVSYTIQNDSPDQPYIYMKREKPKQCNCTHDHSTCQTFTPYVDNDDE